MKKAKLMDIYRNDYFIPCGSYRAINNGYNGYFVRLNNNNIEEIKEYINTHYNNVDIFISYKEFAPELKSIMLFIKNSKIKKEKGE